MSGDLGEDLGHVDLTVKAGCQITQFEQSPAYRASCVRSGGSYRTLRRSKVAAFCATSGGIAEASNMVNAERPARLGFPRIPVGYRFRGRPSDDWRDRAQDRELSRRAGRLVGPDAGRIRVLRASLHSACATGLKQRCLFCRFVPVNS